LLNLIDWHQAHFDVTAADRASPSGRLRIDASTWEIWPHLCAGATISIADERDRRSPTRCENGSSRTRLRSPLFPTMMAMQLLHIDWPANTSFKTLLTGADVLHRRPISGLLS